MAATSAPVLVTGSTGFIAAWTVRKLLEKGYRVRGTVRSLANEEKLRFLREMEGAEDRLELVEANLNEPESFMEPAQGCEFIMHIASPYIVNVEDPKRDLLDPAVNGTLAVMRAAKAAGCRKVILTSSLAAVADSFEDGKVYDETDFNDQSSLTRSPYYYSKVCAERAAHEFVEQNPGLELAVICPFMTLGPHLSGGVNESANFLVQIFAGKQPLVDISVGVSDVRDMAAAHILAMEKPEAVGRYLCCQSPVSFAQMMTVLRASFPAYSLPSTVLPNSVVRAAVAFGPSGTRDAVNLSLGRVPFINNAAATHELGLVFTPVPTTLIDQVNDLIKHGHISAPKNACVIA